MDESDALELLVDNFDILFNDGFVSFGVICDEVKAMVAVDEFKTVTLVCGKSKFAAAIFDRAGIPNREPVTAKEVAAADDTVRVYHVGVAGRTLDAMQSKLEKSYGLSFDHYAGQEPSQSSDEEAQGDEGPYVEPKPVAYELENGAVVVLPATWTKLQASVRHPEGEVSFGMQTGSSRGMLTVRPLEPEVAMPFDDPEAIIDTIHQNLGEDQGVIEVRSSADEDRAAALGQMGERFIYSIVKTLLEPPAAQYTLLLHVDRGGRLFEVKGFIEEIGRTGARDAMIFALARESKAVGTVEDPFAGWWCDPYDADYSKGALMNLSERERYDELFPQHPLSEARRVARYVIEERAQTV